MIDLSITTFLITLVNIGILFFAFRAILLKPVTKFINDRARKIREDIEAAERDKQGARQLLEQYEARLAAVEADAEAILRTAREQAAAEAGEIAAEGQAEAARIIAAARARTETEYAAAMALFRAEAAALVVKAAGRLLQRELAGAEHLRYAAEVLDRMKSPEAEQ
ncbi:MAG: ATP synthase F0 subunit B [Treponema sp.]|jgi:F-type H+-transporting ATPase subunit b|nr:ATP synthase F0 subunit B [Treponema sp.]